MKETRRAQIESMITQRQSISMQELCDAFGVSMNTIRADVAYLVGIGTVEKVYGGIRAKGPREVPLFKTRSLLHMELKRRLAQAAAACVDDGDILYVDSGTTTMHILDFLDERRHVTIVTPSIPVITQVCGRQNLELVVLPGMYNRRTNALLDGGTAEYLGRYQHTKAFLGVSGIAPNGALGVSSYLEYEVKRTAIERSLKKYLLVDSSKYGEAGLMPYGTMEQIDFVITDAQMPDAFLQISREAGASVQLV